MNTSVAHTSASHSLRYYRQRERIVFDRIPGVAALRGAKSEEETAALKAQYPDAVFALMTAANLFCQDRELNAIHLKAYRAILEGESIASVRYRYDYELEQYLERHLWDD